MVPKNGGVVSVVATHDPVGERCKILSRAAKLASGTGSFGSQLMGPFAGSLYTNNRRKRELATASVLADPLADGCLIPLGVEEVVSDLKGEAKGPTKPVEKSELGLGCVHGKPPELEGSPKEGAGLTPVNPFHPGYLVVCGC